jgi:hypothetical protein
MFCGRYKVKIERLSMSSIRLITVLFLLLFFSHSSHLPAQESQYGKVTFQSSDSDLNQIFEWAKKQALDYAFEDDSVGLWYEAALPGREAFCMRDVSHQSMGAHVLGLADHTKNMLMKFAEHISESKDWCSYWEINRYGEPPLVDFRSDTEFWYNLPANFDVLDCCYRMYTWTGDLDYINNPIFQNFYKRTVYDYVERWDLGLDSIMKRQRIMNTRGHVDPGNRFQRNRGIPSYDEGGDQFVVAIDQLCVQKAGYLAYARIQQLRGNEEAANRFIEKSKKVEAFIDRFWWDEGNKRYFSHLNLDHQLVFQGISRAVPYWRATSDESKIMQIIDDIVDESIHRPADRVEGLSHLSEIMYTYGKHEAAYDLLMKLANSDRRNYPEVPFAVVGTMVTGLMGIELEINPPDMAFEWGGYVDRFLTTLPRLTGKTSWAQLDHLVVRKNDVSVRHEGLRKTTLTNHQGPSLIWKAKFPGMYENLMVKGRPVRATQERSFATNQEISWVRIAVGAGETITVDITK